MVFDAGVVSIAFHIVSQSVGAFHYEILVKTAWHHDFSELQKLTRLSRLARAWHSL